MGGRETVKAKMPKMSRANGGLGYLRVLEPGESHCSRLVSDGRLGRSFSFEVSVCIPLVLYNSID